MSATGSLPQPLLWVNHDVNNRRARPHRRTVFSHVQRSWKKWKRQADTLALRKSARVPDAMLADAPQPVMVILQHGRQNILETESQHCPSAEDVTRDKRPHEGELRTMATRPHPQTILGKGNSDPFHAFAIPIDAQVADMLAYEREMYLPEIFSHINAPNVRAAVKRAFAESVTFLHDECTVYPHIAKIAAVMPKGSVAPELQSQIPTFKMKGLASLRKMLIDPESLRDPRASASMLLFLTAELYEGNLEAASFHARMIAHLLQRRLVPLNFLFLFSALYDDTQRASFSLSRPAFDVKTWVPQQLVPVDSRTTEKLRSGMIAEAYGPVDFSIQNSSMRAIITEANQCSIIALHMSRDQINTDNQTTFRFGCRRMACMGTVINHYIDSREKMRHNKLNDLEVLREARMEAQICLALLYLMRREAKMDMFWIRAKFGVFSENSNILNTLQDLIREDEGSVDEKYARAKLFALFVGTWAAHTNARLGATYAPVDKESFNMQFVAQAMMMRLWSWKAVQEVLEGFHFLDLLQPDASTVWQTMSPRHAQNI